MPKCISKFEMKITDFHSEWNNVVSSGGPEPNGTLVQMNVSSLGVKLEKSIGMQGCWHIDQSGDRANWTLVTMLLHVGPGEQKDSHIDNMLYSTRWQPWTILLCTLGTVCVGAQLLDYIAGLQWR
jgi:hypothetical protein